MIFDLIRGKYHREEMRTINRKPIKTEGYLCKSVITWQCHGITQDGNRIYWAEYTHTPFPDDPRTLAEYILSAQIADEEGQWAL
jgi:hypothetical protein